MVHALELARELLSTNGILVDLHPQGHPSPVQALVHGRRQRLGEIHETDDFIEYRQADEALRNIVRRGYFALERQSSFKFKIYTTTLDELRNYLSEAWSDAIISPEIEANAAHFVNSFSKDDGDLSFEVIEQVRICRLRRLG
jgi:hypothetical protein